MLNNFNLAVLASGRGSNFEALVKAAKNGELDVTFCLLIVSNADAGVLDIAARHNIPTAVICRLDFSSREDFVAAMEDALEASGAGWLALAGYMKKIPPEIIAQFSQRIFNIHPGLLPAFGGKGMYGRKVHQAVLDAGCKLSGVTIHMVDGHYDHGPIVAQQAVVVLPGDDAEMLAARVLKAEHRLYARVLQAAAKGRLHIEDNKAWID